LDRLWKDTLKEKEKLLKEIEFKKQELMNKNKEPKETENQQLQMLPKAVQKTKFVYDDFVS
jgi:hypothetical protein